MADAGHRDAFDAAEKRCSSLCLHCATKHGCRFSRAGLGGKSRNTDNDRQRQATREQGPPKHQHSCSSRSVSTEAGHPGFTLADFCDGYVYQPPFNEYEGATTDSLFVTAENMTRAVQGILHFDARANYKTPADFTRSMRELADIPRLFVVWQVLASPPPTGR